jgi:signal peptidase I
MALIPLCAGVGILRKRVWSAYGFAVYTLAQLALLPVVLLRSADSAGALGTVAMTAAFSLGVGLLFLFAGRSLARAGTSSGRAWPWIAVSACVILPLLFVEAFVNPTGSMEDTLLVGDRVLVQRFPPPTPKRGDVMVFVYPIDRKQTFTKRIVGTPGDRIKIVHKTLYRNGAVLNEPYAGHKLDYEDSYRDNFPSEPSTPIFPAAQAMLLKNVVNGEVVVPAGKYFVLGDNRDMSLDSRYWGFVSSGDFIGKPLMIYDSVDQTMDEAMSNSALHRGPTRWNRLFRLL